MPTRHISDREALRHMMPHTPADRHALARVVAYLFVVIASLAGFALLQHHYQYIRETTWQSATATIIDARRRLVTQGLSHGGGAMLYQVEVRVTYTSNSVNDRWITVTHAPTLLSATQFAIFRWKGQRCTVRWKPSDPTNPIAEAN